MEGFVDVGALTYDELKQLRQVALDRMRELTAVAEVPAQMARMAATYLSAMDVESGDVWVEPSGYENAYPEGWVVSHAGKSWVSNYDGNFTEPGVRGWRELVEEGEYPDFVKPPGYEDAYNTGDRARWTDGLVYESNIDGNTWTPAEAPNRWDLVDEED